MAAYRLALEMHADYIEQDLQLTKDGVLICTHDPSLERVTDVEEVFPDRGRITESGGKKVSTWPVVDFTLEEIRKLDFGSWFDPKFKNEGVATFQESIDLAKGKCGIYPEIKKSEFMAADGSDIVDEVHRVLRANGLDRAAARKRTPVVVQCFYPEMLKRLRRISDHAYPLLQLIWFTQVDELLTDEKLAEVAKYADGIGPVLSMVLQGSLAHRRSA